MARKSVNQKKMVEFSGVVLPTEYRQTCSAVASIRPHCQSQLYGPYHLSSSPMTDAVLPVKSYQVNIRMETNGWSLFKVCTGECTAHSYQQNFPMEVIFNAKKLNLII